MIEAMARKVALDALDGRAAAQKFVLEILEGADCGAAACTRTLGEGPRRGGPRPSKRPDERGGESDEEDDEGIGRNDRTNFPDAGKKAGKILKMDITHKEHRQAFGAHCASPRERQIPCFREFLREFGKKWRSHVMTGRFAERLRRIPCFTEFLREFGKSGGRMS